MTQTERPKWMKQDPNVLTFGQTVRVLKEHLGIQPRLLAQITGANERSVKRWASDDYIPQRKSRNHLIELGQLYGRLRRTFTDPDAAREWLNTPALYLADARPVEMLAAGRLDKVNATLEVLDSGIYI